MNTGKLNGSLHSVQELSLDSPLDISLGSPRLDISPGSPEGVCNSHTVSLAKSPMLPLAMVSAIVLATVNSAVAENTDFNRRLYLGLNAGLTNLKPESRTSALSVGEENSGGGSIFVGYDLSPRFAVEGYYTNLGESQIDFLGDDVGSVEYQTYGVSVLGYLFNSRDSSDYETGFNQEGLYRREGLSGYLRAGIGGLENTSNLDYEQDYGTHVSFGAGVEYGWSNGIGLRAEISSYDTDAQFVNVGLLKRFGRSAKGSPMINRDTDPVSDPVVNRGTPENSLVGVLPDLPTAYFAFDKSDLTSAARAKLDLVVREMLADPAMALTVQGHADSTGTEAYNLALSLRRAETVQQYLVSRSIEPSRLRIEGYGEQIPLEDNATSEGRSLNRRVEFTLQ